MLFKPDPTLIVCNVRQGDSGDVYDYYGDYIIRI